MGLILFPGGRAVDAARELGAAAHLSQDLQESPSRPQDLVQDLVLEHTACRCGAVHSKCLGTFLFRLSNDFIHI